MKIVTLSLITIFIFLASFDYSRTSVDMSTLQNKYCYETPDVAGCAGWKH